VSTARGGRQLAAAVLSAALAAWLGWLLIGQRDGGASPAVRDPSADTSGAPIPQDHGPERDDLPADTADAGPAAADEPEHLIECTPLVLRGRVLDAEGRPLPGATVVLPQGMLDRSRWERATTGADGRYELAFTRMARPGAEDEPVAESRRTVVEAEASADGCLPARAFAAFVGERMQLGSLDFTLAFRVTLAGRVTWDDGAPCADAAVTLERPVALGARVWSQQGRQLAVARTDAEGAFKVELGGGQVVELSLDADGYRPATPVRVELPSRGTASATVVLPRPAALHVHLAGGSEEGFGTWPGRTPRLVLVDPAEPFADRAQQPLLSREIDFERVDPLPAWDVVLPLPSGGWTTLRKGLRLPPGQRIDLDLLLDDALLARLSEVRPPAPATTATFRWRLTDEAGATLTLAEFSRRAELVDGVRVRARARSLATGEVGDVDMSHPDASPMTGTGRICGVAPPVELELDLGDRIVRQAPVSDGAQVVFVVPEPQGWATLHVRATDGHGAARLLPLVYVHRLDQPGVRVVLPDTATVTCTALLPPGDYVVQSDPVGEAEARRRVRLEAGEVRTLELAGGAGGLVRGRVEPAPAVDEVMSVQAHPEHAAIIGFAAQARVTADGDFELAGLSAGAWQLVGLRGPADGGAQALATQVVAVESGRTTVAVVVFEPQPSTRAVRIRRSHESPGLVRLEALDGGPALSWPLSPGDERRLLLPPGRWRLATLPMAPEAWPTEEPRVTDFEIRPDSPPDELLIDA
jgi:hypothetical protein